MGVLPQKIFGLNGVIFCKFRQNKHGKCTFMKVRDRVYDGLGEGTWHCEVIRIF